ncbi:MAG: hypothetical protein LBU65_01900, partial [Planctomycetaceae bacterium]|nr:hypothetical protein [Planctomycetaceae bacterium]
TLKGVITADKKAELYVNGGKAAAKKLDDLITENPIEALQIGTDTGGKVNGEDQPIYKGWIERIVIRREK